MPSEFRTPPKRKSEVLDYSPPKPRKSRQGEVTVSWGEFVASLLVLYETFLQHQARAAIQEDLDSDAETLILGQQSEA